MVRSVAAALTFVLLLVLAPSLGAQEESRGPKPIQYRTAFWPDTVRERGRVPGHETILAPVSSDAFHSAPWLVPPTGEVPHAGRVVGFAGAEEIRVSYRTLRPFDELRVEFRGGVPPVGTELQTFRVAGSLLEGDRIAMPTGVLEVVRVEAAGAVARVRSAYDRMTRGDFVRVAPPLPPEAGREPESVSDGLTATVLGFAETGAVRGVDDLLFLDQGASDGLGVGDELALVWSGEEGWGPEVEGRVQVVAVQNGIATARITSLSNPVFARGVRVRLDKRVP